MVEMLIVKLPDGTKAALKKVALDGGYMHLSDLVRDWIRQGLIAAREAKGPSFKEKTGEGS